MSSAPVLSLPPDVFTLVLCRLPISSLPALAMASKALSQLVAHETHWRRRLRDLGALELCAAHPAKDLYPGKNPAHPIDWHAYYGAFHVLLDETRFLARTLHDAELRTPLYEDDRLTGQFPRPISNPGTRVAHAAATEPFLTSYAERAQRAGSERGLFLIGTQWHFFDATRQYCRPLMTTEIFTTQVHVSHAELRAAKSAALLHLRALPAPLGLTQAEYHWHLLQTMVHAAKCAPHEASEWPQLDRIYRSALASLKPVTISVTYNDTTATFRVRSIKRLLAEINAKFGFPRLEGNTQIGPVYTQHISLQDLAEAAKFRQQEANERASRRRWRIEGLTLDHRVTLGSDVWRLKEGQRWVCQPPQHAVQPGRAPVLEA